MSSDDRWKGGDICHAQRPAVTWPPHVVIDRNDNLAANVISIINIGSFLIPFVKKSKQRRPACGGQSRIRNFRFHNGGPARGLCETVVLKFTTS